MNDARKVGSSVVVVEVQDVNDNLPRFSQDVYSVSIIENLPTSFSVMQVSASDPDEVVTYYCYCSCSIFFRCSISSSSKGVVMVEEWWLFFFYIYSTHTLS